MPQTKVCLPPPVLTCAYCGETFTRRTVSGGRPQRYCRSQCGKTAWLVAKRLKRRQKYLFDHPRCTICDAPLRRVGDLTCSRPCALRRYNWFTRRSRARELDWFLCVGCRAIFKREAQHQRFCTKNCGARHRYWAKRRVA